MKFLEVPYNGQTFGYIVGQNGVKDITHTKGNHKVVVTAENEAIGEYKTYFWLDLLPVYTIG